MNKFLKKVQAEFPVGESCHIAIVGEAPGEDEARTGRPFVGASGRLLNSMLKDVGIDRSQCLVTNVFTERPPQNNVKHFFDKKSVRIAALKADGMKHKDAQAEVNAHAGELFGTTGFIKQEYVYELERLKAELEQFKPNVVIAMGATALWALTKLNKIGTYRGIIMPSTLVPGVKIMPTYHPAAVIRMWTHRPTVMADLAKAKDEAASPIITRVQREIWIRPNYADLVHFERHYLRGADMICYDIETIPGTEIIQCIGFAPDQHRAIIVPLYSAGSPGGSYWSRDDEIRVHRWIRNILEDDNTKKLAQNSLFDIQYLLKYGIKVRGPIEDTMLMHHALQPELPKGLGHLASLYTNEGAWKTMVSFKRSDNIKKDS